MQAAGEPPLAAQRPRKPLGEHLVGLDYVRMASQAEPEQSLFELRAHALAPHGVDSAAPGVVLHRMSPCPVPG
jgi:hypothetical protein